MTRVLTRTESSSQDVCVSSSTTGSRSSGVLAPEKVKDIRVLLVEDDDFQRDVLEQLCETCGYNACYPQAKHLANI